MDLNSFALKVETVFPIVLTNKKHLAGKIEDDKSLARNELLSKSFHYFVHNQQLHLRDLHQYNYVWYKINY